MQMDRFSGYWKQATAMLSEGQLLCQRQLCKYLGEVFTTIIPSKLKFQRLYAGGHHAYDCIIFVVGVLWGGSQA
jgi:hypothetical protein